MTIQDGITAALTRKELVTVTNALNEVINGPDAIQEWEFSSRMGAERSEAEALLVKLSALLTSIKDG
jgi:hypothetical protein